MTRVVTMDGPAGSGKSTTAKHVAAALGGVALDSGSFYRIVANELIFASIDPADEPEIMEHLDGLHIEGTNGVACRIGGRTVTYELLKGSDVEAIVSAVSRHQSLRNRVNLELRTYASTLDCWVVCDGRDAGHVIFPEASKKLYLNAPPRIRAERIGRTLQEIMDRDRSDMTTKGEGNLFTLEQARKEGYYIVNASEAPDDVVNYCLEAILGNLV